MKKILAFIMAMLMILSCFAALSVGVFAAEGDEVVDGEDTPAEPDLSVQYEINFRKYDEDVSDVLGNMTQQIEVVKEAKSGYATFNATEGATDPYIVFSGYTDISADKMIYAVIKYRTSADFQGEGYLQFVKENPNEEAAGWGAATQYAPFFGGAGTWQVIKVDLTKLADIQESARAQNIRLDLAPNVSFDLAYIKFFASVEGADAQIAAEQVSKTLKGEMNEGDARIVKLGDGVYYSALDLVALSAKEGSEGVYVDADGAEYTLRGNYLLKADGTDTGLSLITDVDGKAYGYAHAYQLAYIDPEAAAVEIDGVKYVYGAKADATANKMPVAPEGATPGTRPTTTPFAGQVSTDTIKVNGNPLVVNGIGEINGKVADYQAVYGSNIYDTAKTLESIGFHGWALNTAAIPDAFGYMINDGAPVWNDSFLIVDPGLYPYMPGGSENVRRYDITIPTADLDEGIYAITLLVKFGEDVFSINTDNGSPTQWGELTFVKGGSEEIVSYSVGADVYTLDDEGALLLNGAAAPASTKLIISGDTVDTTTAVLYTNLEEFSEGATGKYVYDTAVSYVEAPAVPFNLATLTPVYLLDGEDMIVGGTNMTIEYNYDEGFVTYTTTVPGDPNAGSPLYGEIIGRYMVIKYRTTNAVSDSVFVSMKGNITGDSNIPVGFITDGQWNHTIVDLAVTTDYIDGQPVAGTRFDLIADGYIDIAYFAFFDSELAAQTYIEEGLWSAPAYYTATFVNEAGETVKEVMFREGATELWGVPFVPKKDGFNGAWAEYTLGNVDITIAPVYTADGSQTPDTNAPEAGTDAPEAGTDAPEAGTDAPEAGTDAPEAGTDAPEAGTDAPEAGTDAGTTADTDADADEGCSSVVGFGAIAVIVTAAAAAAALKKKED